MNTNEIISYDLSLSPNLEQIHRMLDRAFEKFPDVSGLIFHSDQGWQYQHAYFRNILKEHGIISEKEYRSISLSYRVKKLLKFGKK